MVTVLSSWSRWKFANPGHFCDDGREDVASCDETGRLFVP